MNLKDDISANQSRKDGILPDKPEGEEKRDASTFAVKHNKQTKELTLDELIAAAEKGLDYDRIRPSHDFVKRLAAKDGENDVGRYIEKMSGGAGQNKEQTPQNAVAGADSRFGELAQLVVEYPEVLKDGKLNVPREVDDLVRGGTGALEAFRLYDLKKTKEQCTELKARLEAERINRSNQMAAVGSLSGGGAVEKDFYSSAEWDRLPQQTKDKYVKNGKIFEFMRKWSGNR